MLLQIIIRNSVIITVINYISVTNLLCIKLIFRKLLFTLFIKIGPNNSFQLIPMINSQNAPQVEQLSFQLGQDR